MISRRAPSWQLILADLALILFLVTLSALANQAPDSVHMSDRAMSSAQAAPQIAASQALFRPAPLGPDLDQWLSEQSADPRATLTVFAQHGVGDRPAIWEQAQALASDAERAGFAVRVVITPGQISDVYASLAYDAPTDASVPTPRR